MFVFAADGKDLKKSGNFEFPKKFRDNLVVENISFENLNFEIKLPLEVS